ncbi:MAG: hypothetical protein Q7T54_03730 [Candidatus Levybacteria bacterium]|nr:hypothetical protein [Candidatus Levybacteria bacterium]
MNKYIALLLILSALMPLGIDVAKVHAATSKPDLIVASNKPYDLRTQALENVLKRYNSPLTYHAAAYIKTADKYGMDWKLLPSIAGLESTFGKRQMPGSYNSYGWGGGRIYFESVEHGIDTVLFGLKNRYVARGATTVETIAPIYSESPTWAPRVRLFMKQFEAEYDKLSKQHLALSI